MVPRRPPTVDGDRADQSAHDLTRMLVRGLAREAGQIDRFGFTCLHTVGPRRPQRDRGLYGMHFARMPRTTVPYDYPSV
ncbi:hypothetical protein AMK16_27285 [Streptomyces sp. CB00455]|nr:hypothetical protein AMK16_27285 [Streptomyces sp. CB00455]